MEGTEETPPPFFTPEGQEWWRQHKERDWEENSMPPSEVFARRLRERRGQRDLTLDQLSARMGMLDRPMKRSTLSDLEKGKKRLLLDDAFALTVVLEAVPLYMLTPPGEMNLRLSGTQATNAAGVEEWLLYGLREPLSGRRRQQPPEELWPMEDARASSLAVRREKAAALERLAQLARALVQALDLDKPELASKVAGRLRAEVLHQERSASSDD